MLPIHKNPEDPLRKHRSTPNTNYDNCPKDLLKNSLLQEQNFLCAYCMSRITEHTMSIEHWKCRSQHPNLELSYQNLLAVCDGNEGNPPCKQHCDTRKGDSDLMYNPANKDHHERLKIRYLRNTGKIESADKAFCIELGDTEKGSEGILNLNHQQIMNNRRAVIASVERAMNKLPHDAKKAQIRALLNAWNSVDAQGMLPEYAGVAIYFLKKRLERAQ
ncbi:MAG: hypothetical protein QM579_13795 [Desulfovibrio sp.]|uniref:hypothetical protein n=1 Tax=Desulfovibrio sp. TaxID=885 RepID=UPI0039E24612